MDHQPQYRFETPENVQVRYEAAGLGTRFIAWFVDQILVSFLTILLFVAFVIIAASWKIIGEPDFEEGPQRIMLYVGGIMMLLWGFGSFFYFTLSELLMRGQSVGKKTTEIRVVKANGFQLDAGSIVMRNAFRVLDQLPPMWIVPFISKRSQRTGDMVAGTLVVSDAAAVLSPVREVLSARPASDSQFHFDRAALDRATESDFAALEQFLGRSAGLAPEVRQSLLEKYTTQLVKKLQVEPPTPNERFRFLEDLYAAEMRRRDRKLV